MDIQKQIEFEKFHARECNCDYDELKRRLDHQEKVMGHRYIPSSPRHEAWLVWNAAWKAKAQVVPEWISVEDRMPEEGEEVWVHHYGHIVQATKDKKYSGGFKQRNCRGWESVSCYISHWMSMSIKLPEIYNFYYEHDAKVAQEKAIIEAQEQSHD